MSLISIIVPIYNTEPYLARCVDSILNQSFIDFELLLVDDGSTDGSGAVCDTYAERDGRIRVFHKENGGVSSARNMGIKASKGEWITFVDSDDELLPDGLQVMIDGTSEEVDMVMAGYYEYHGETQLVDTSKCGPAKVINRNDALLMMYPSTGLEYMGYSWGKLFKRNIILNKGVFFDENVRFKEDTLFVVEYLCDTKNQCFCTNVPVYKYMQLPTGVMGGLRQTYNPNYLHGFDVVVKMNRIIQALPDVSKALSRASKFEVVNRVFHVYGHMRQNCAVDKKVVTRMKISAIREVGIRNYLTYLFWGNKRRAKNFIKKKRI